MFRLAINNVFTRKLRSIFALVGLAIAIMGIICLISISAGLRECVNISLSKIEGLVVIRKDSLDPILSKLPASLEEKIEAIPQVSVVAPEIWELAPRVEGRNTLLEGMFTAQAIFGTEPAKYSKLKGGGLYGRHMKEGKFLEPGEEGSLVTVISRRTAERFAKKVGDKISIGNQVFTIKGIYDTGVFFLDAALIMPIQVARQKHLIPPDVVSNFFVDVKDVSDIAAAEAAIERLSPDIDAKNTSEWSADFSAVAFNLDAFLLAIASIGVVVGTIGILNTMLMSVTERVAEIGILKANGWQKKDVLVLVLYESLILGVVGGVVGCGAGCAGAKVAGLFLPMEPVVAWWLIVAGMLLAAVLGVLGGLYPASYAARMSPIDAIRFE
jgi:putative ABC transport system permease protein